MMQLRQLRLTGRGAADAIMTFAAAGNVVAGDSDTGKSYMLRCIDYVFGAEVMTKVIKEAGPYERVLVELENDQGEFLTLVRALAGGDIEVHHAPIEKISDDGIVIKWMRKGTSKLLDVTSVLLPFAGIQEAQLRKNKQGKKQRLTIRTLVPVFLVDEITIIAERSPVIGTVGFDTTARKRMLSYLLTGKDDEAVIADEKKEIASARSAAKISLLDDLLAPIDARLSRFSDGQDEEGSIELTDAAIEQISAVIDENSTERAQLMNERREVVDNLHRAESQLVAINELSVRYRLLDDRYGSDLDRLDFISEGAHYFGSLQEVRCPLCDQAMDGPHQHWQSDSVAAQPVYSSARAEAAKIIGHRADLGEAVKDLQQRRSDRSEDREKAQARLEQIETRLTEHLLPTLRESKSRLETMIQRRLELEGAKLDREKAKELRALRLELENSAASAGTSSKKWAGLGAAPLRALCDEIEAVLREWSWKDTGRVVFDEKAYDIEVDGQPRQSHGKGVRAILYAAFVIGLLRYCRKNHKPHPGFVVLDSPLTTYKKGQPKEPGIDPGIETAFWASLASLPPGLQVVVVDNKEPPPELASGLKYEWFGGQEAGPDDRVGFIP
ncbi:hypothetical protein [Bradyrhizobium sp. 195]|uniref:hypothetical protein n=1 Tax=Bradyrhizobium sp. 195 TaxID=2782662 RepID=UPI002001D363|nr:hypothetical protein [Bradyrhizobium sp. 195]UPK27648.1 hypothetical protein IVB26_03280 [Bradyrhizobium sp. 195]